MGQRNGQPFENGQRLRRRSSGRDAPAGGCDPRFPNRVEKRALGETGGDGQPEGGKDGRQLPLGGQFAGVGDLAEQLPESGRRQTAAHRLQAGSERAGCHLEGCLVPLGLVATGKVDPLAVGGGEEVGVDVERERGSGFCGQPGEKTTVVLDVVGEDGEPDKIAALGFNLSRITGA